jgi:hypothetical protein
MKRAALTFGLLLTLEPLWAQEPNPSPTPGPAPPALPLVGPELGRLSHLVGEFVHSEIFHPSPLGPGGKGAARSKGTWILGDHYLYLLYASRRPGGLYEARGFFFWDGEAKVYHLDWFDDLGARKRYAGEFTAKGALVMTAEYSLDGQPARERLTFNVREDGKILMASEVAVGEGAPTPVMESLLSPVSPSRGH